MRESMGMITRAIKVRHVFLAPSLIAYRVHSQAIIAMAVALSATFVWVLGSAINIGVAQR